MPQTNVTQVTAAPPELDKRQVRVVMSGLLLVLLLAALDSTIVATALPTIVGELGGRVGADDGGVAVVVNVGDTEAVVVLPPLPPEGGKRVSPMRTVIAS